MFSADCVKLKELCWEIGCFVHKITFLIIHCNDSRTSEMLKEIISTEFALLFLHFVFIFQVWATTRTCRPVPPSWRSSPRSCSRARNSTRWPRRCWPTASRGSSSSSPWWEIRESCPSPWRLPMWCLVLSGSVLISRLFASVVNLFGRSKTLQFHQKQDEKTSWKWSTFILRYTCSRHT